MTTYEPRCPALHPGLPYSRCAREKGHGMLRVARIVHDYEEQRRIGPPETPPSHDTPSMLDLLDGDPS